MNPLTIFDFTPRDRRKVSLFANTAEAIVFWLSLSGLVFLAIMVLFRYFTAERTARDYDALAARQAELSSAWESQSRRMNAQIDSLSMELEKSRIEIARLHGTLNQAGPPNVAAPPALPVQRVRPEQRSRAFLDAFKVEKPESLRVP